MRDIEPALSRDRGLVWPNPDFSCIHGEFMNKYTHVHSRVSTYTIARLHTIPKKSKVDGPRAERGREAAHVNAHCIRVRACLYGCMLCVCVCVCVC